MSDSIWIDPPSDGSPIPVRKTVQGVPFGHWDSGSPVAPAGLRSKDFKLEKATVFETAPGDLPIGEVEAGTIMVARPGKPKLVVLGFHPALSPLRYELTWPLLFANVLRWVSPDIFLRSEVSGASVGAVKLQVGEDVTAKDIKVTAGDGSPLTFTLRDRTLDFFAGAPGSVQVLAGDQVFMYSLTLPQLWDSKWTPPANVRRGVPKFREVESTVFDIWPWLAVLGAAGLLAEWILYGRFRMAQFAANSIHKSAPVEVHQ